MTSARKNPFSVPTETDESIDCFPEGVELWPAGTELGIDVAAITHYFAQLRMPLDPSFAIRRFSGGLANRNYLVRMLDGRWLVLRCPPPGPLPPGANDMRREHRILSQLWAVLPLAPRSYHLCEDPSVIGCAFQLLEYRAGVAIRGAQLSPLQGGVETTAALSSMLVTTLASIHDVSPVTVGLDTLGRPENFFARTVSGWSERADIAINGKPSTAAKELVRWLRAVPELAAGDTVLLHNDFKLDNVLVDIHTLRPTAVVDWDMGTRGPAMFDLATLLSYWTEPGDPDCMHQLAQMPTALPGFLSREQVAREYERTTGRTINQIQPFRVLTLFKLATVFLQLHRRYTNKEISDTRYAAFGQLGEDLFGFALDVAYGDVF